MRSGHNAEKNFQVFHGRSPEKFGSFNFTMPRKVTFLGNVYAIEYVSNKKLKGTFKSRLYRHKTGPGVKMYLHPNGRTLIIEGGRFRVTDWLRG